MVNPAAANTLPVMMPNDASVNAETQPHKQNAAVVVQQSAEARSQSHNYGAWPKKDDEPEKREPSSVDTSLDELNKKMEAWATGLRFDVDEDTDKLVVSLVDSKTGDVIRSLPSDAALQISKMIAQFHGNSINTKA